MPASATAGGTGKKPSASPTSPLGPVRTTTAAALAMTAEMIAVATTTSASRSRTSLSSPPVTPASVAWLPSVGSWSVCCDM
jgi:hypothetical protein